MKNHLRYIYAIGFLLIIFIMVSALTFNKSKIMIQKGYLASEGNFAENFAILAASNIHITDKQLSHLKQCSYKEMINSDENKELRRMMSNDSFTNKVDYAYIMIHLKGDEVKYKVTPEVKNRFNVPVGTKLDIMWLLDVSVSNEAKQNQLNNDEYQRYSYYIEEDKQIFGEAPTYIYNESQWGNHICGYAPIYTTSGKYIGVLGIELKTIDYDKYCRQAVLAMGILLLVSLVMLTILFLYIYYSYKKTHFDKIYIDSLTNCLIEQMQKVFLLLHYRQMHMKRT